MKTLYLFNPENDMALAVNDVFYMPPASALRMASDLSVLAAWYASPGDAVLVAAPGYVRQMKAQCPLLPPVNFVTMLSPSYDEVAPWGWSPSLVRRLHEAGFPVTACPSAERIASIRELSGRQTAVKVLRSLRRTISECMPCAPMVGEAFVLSSVEEIEEFVLSRARVLLKSPWSGSGRGIRYIFDGEFSTSLKGWVVHVLRTQQAIVCEPLYDKVVDFAMEFLSAADGQVHFVGYSFFETDKRGVYKENRLATNAAIEAWLSIYLPPAFLRWVCRELQSELAQVIKGGYRGYLGVDMMVCRVGETYALHPCVEINLRMNMGVVARLVYDKYVCSGAVGRYVIEYYARTGEAERAHSEMQLQYPLQIEKGRVKAGYLSLTPVGEDTAYQAYIIIN